jgi:hypothetical protein
MRVIRRGAVLRSGVAVGVFGLLAAAAATIPTNHAFAAAPDDFTSAPASNQQWVSLGGDMATLAPAAQYVLSPQLAAMLGTPTITLAQLTKLREAARPMLPGDKTPAVGTQLFWPAIDATHEGVTGIYLKQYTLRAVGQHIEVWVASGNDGVSSGTAFPNGDCRNDTADSTAVTDDQVKALINEFDNNMYPKETATFSTPKDRPGTNTIPGIAALGVDFAGDAGHTVTLVDNVRDPNFYDFPKNKTYIAGFYAPIFNVLTDRNVMTIDAFDWIHRTGANPKNEPSEDLCKSRPARPRAYEGVFAHEWQHLLQNYQDPQEATWVNEGLSDFAIGLVGYGDTRRNVHQTHAESHIFCFHGYGTVKGPSNPNPNDCGGAENSLTMWQDEGTGSEVLADYGNAWSFMQFLADRYGRDFMSDLHKDGADQGLKGVQTQLDKYAKGTTLAQLLHDYQLMNLLDHYASQKGAQVKGIPASRITTKSLDSTINLDNPTSYKMPGVGPNGADYILLKDGDKPMPGKALRKFDFLGNATVAGSPTDDPTVTIPPSTDSAGGAKVENWYVSLVGLDPKTNRILVKSFDKAFDASLDAKQLKAFASYPQVIAVISHDDTDDVNSGAESYAGYTLTINGKDETDGGK